MEILKKILKGLGISVLVCMRFVIALEDYICECEQLAVSQTPLDCEAGVALEDISKLRIIIGRKWLMCKQGS